MENKKYMVEIRIRTYAYVDAIDEKHAEGKIYSDEFAEYLMNGHDIISCEAQLVK